MLSSYNYCVISHVKIFTRHVEVSRSAFCPTVEVSALTDGVHVRGLLLYHGAVGQRRRLVQRVDGLWGGLVRGRLKGGPDRGRRGGPQVLALGGDLGRRGVEETHWEDTQKHKGLANWQQVIKLIDILGV